MSSVQYIIMYDCCYCLRYTLLAGGITKKQVRYLIILESTHLWVTVSVSPVPSGTSLAFFDSMCTVVSGTVFIVIRLHASDRIKLIIVHQRIFDKKQYFLRQLHDCLQAINTDIWTWWSSIAAVRRRLWSKCRCKIRGLLLFVKTFIKKELYNKLVINLECLVCTEKSRASVHTTKASGRDFSVQTARSVDNQFVFLYIYIFFQPGLQWRCTRAAKRKCFPESSPSAVPALPLLLL